ncbi:MAG TPA: hypothetical protein VFI33_12180, partial [Puia sp.]|nr:hypothetical protein [Puia sp.]
MIPFTFFVLISLINYGQTCSLISQQEAEKILGKPAHLSSHTTETKNHILTYHCTYTANDQETDRDRQSNLYYMLEEFESSSEAQKTFKYILSQNAGMQGLSTLDGFGEEAFIQTDNDHFQLIIVRKSAKMIRLKVNKVTRT